MLQSRGARFSRPDRGVGLLLVFSAARVTMVVAAALVGALSRHPMLLGRPDPKPRSMLGVALLDDHPAVLAGLRRLIEPQPDMKVIAAAATAGELARRLDGGGTDVLVLDYDLVGGDGLSLCQRIKRRPQPPAVVIYSAYAGDALALAARAAGADGIVHKSDPVERLLTAIRGAATGELVMPALPHDAYQFAAAALDDEDLPVLALLLDRTPIDAIANALRISETQASWQAQRIVGRLRPRLTARFEDHGTRAARRARSGRS